MADYEEEKHVVELSQRDSRFNSEKHSNSAPLKVDKLAGRVPENKEKQGEKK
ncbi:hypothetical protein [uncultured Dysosmobacter sp.]|uniref:hypothetical protein n=1 Tax=uncultured Dysosmobacter sp. TaxID=2591384 RepID=UPI00260B9787|nr:hypothetical protein [uncultured Dysosmobacter sp.]